MTSFVRTRGKDMFDMFEGATIRRDQHFGSWRTRIDLQVDHPAVASAKSAAEAFEMARAWLTGLPHEFAVHTVLKEQRQLDPEFCDIPDHNMAALFYPEIEEAEADFNRVFDVKNINVRISGADHDWYFN